MGDAESVMDITEFMIIMFMIIIFSIKYLHIRK